MRIVNRKLKEVPQFTRTNRHQRARLEHGTLRKWENFIRSKIEKKLRRIELTSLPHFMVIDPCNYCNLRCPLCPTGIGKLGQLQALLSFEHFHQYFETLADYLFEIFLFNWGESLLNKQVFRMIEYSQSRNVGTNLSSNFSDVSSKDLDNILDSGLEYLVVSLDGTSPETYSKYRVRGVYENVYGNMRELIDRRNRRHLKLPVIEWQMIIMRHNEHEIPEAERLARWAGVDLLRFIPVALQVMGEDREPLAKEWFPTNFDGRKRSTDGVEQQFGQAEKPGPCFYLYDTLTVNPTGAVTPCCVIHGQENEFGQLPVDDIRKFWNNPKYQSGRSLFSKRNPDVKVSVVCDGCDIFKKVKK